MKKFDFATRAQILQEYLDGTTGRELAAKFKCSTNYPAVLKNQYKTVRNLQKIAANSECRPDDARPRVNNLELARRFIAGEFDRDELVRRMRGELENA